MRNRNQDVLREKGDKKSARYKRRQAAESGIFPESGELNTSAGIGDHFERNTHRAPP